jgi:hypothetical protein
MRIHVGRWMRRGLLIGAAAGLAAAALPGTPAWAGPVSCGSTITSNTTLTADLVCAGDGLIIGANGITLNLGGHTITGTAGGNGINDGFLTGHFNNVTIRNGKVTGFQIDVTLSGVQNTTLRGLKLSTATYGLRAAGNSTNTRFVSGTVTDAGVRISDSTNASISHSTLTRAPLSLESSANHATIDHDRFVDSPVGLFEDDFTLVTDNTFTRSSFASFASSRNGSFRDNTFQGADIALDVSDNMLNTQVAFNTFKNNRIGLKMRGTPLAFLNGISVSDNTFTNNDAVGAWIESRDAVGLPVSLAVQDNKFTGNGHTPGGLVDGTGQPIADGLHIDVPAGATFLVGYNATKNNGAFGIYAVAGITDAGGNTSVGNPSGCLGVTC